MGMTNQIDALSVDQLWDAVCLATKECSHWSHQSRSIFDAKNIADQEAHLAECPDPGRVWALPGMQEKCPGCNGSGLEKHEHIHGPYSRESCTRCHGTGWVAKRDLAALLDYVFEIRFVGNTCGIRISASSPPYTASRADRKTALLSAVAQALVAQGTELGVTA